MARFPISLQEALKRLSDKLNIECLLQQETRTQVFKMDRTHVVALLEREATKIEESGYFGQRMNGGCLSRHVPKLRSMMKLFGHVKKKKQKN
jgi:hypothetical protein